MSQAPETDGELVLVTLAQEFHIIPVVR